MRDKKFGNTLFSYNLPKIETESEIWEKNIKDNNCYNFGTGRHNSKGQGAFPGSYGKYHDKYAATKEQIIKGVLADGAIYLGFDGNDEQYGKRMPKLIDNEGKIFLMAATCQNGGEYHFFRLFKEGWYQKDGNNKNIEPFKKGDIKLNERDFTSFFCDEYHPIPVGYFLILPTHQVNGKIENLGLKN